MPFRRRVNNFGDLLGPIIVDRMLRDHPAPAGRADGTCTRLFSVGSVLHFATTGDTVWGSGINGKVDPDLHQFTELDVRAVRGPLTRDFLLKRGIEVPEVFGDPALLLPSLVPELNVWARDSCRYPLTVVPNLNDLAHFEPGPNVLNPRSPLWTCLKRIARSDFVVGSSLHAIVVAEALRIPARAIRSRVESEFKYADYYAGTGRDGYIVAKTIKEAQDIGGETPPNWSPQPLIESFPYDLWYQGPKHWPVKES